MNPVRAAIDYPVTTAVGIIFLILFGLIALLWIPVQLSPDVERPRITVQTTWLGASPKEIEREIVQEQEKYLKTVQGLVEMRSQSYENSGEVILEFVVGTDVNAAAVRVANRLDQVPSYPVDADRPVIHTTDVTRSAIAWFLLKDTTAARDVTTLWKFTDDFIKPYLERVPGVSTANIYGGREPEMQVLFDPQKLAARGVTVLEVAEALDRENRDFSAGDFDEGKRSFQIRTVGDYESPQEVASVIVARRDGGIPVYVRDIAQVRLDHKESNWTVRHMGHQSLAVNALQEPGTNVMEVMAGIRKAVVEINDELLEGTGLEFRQVWDQTGYIERAIDLVQSNLFIGGGLAIAVLLLFLRSGSSTFVVAMAIPISIIGTFLTMALLGRSINVISLAGLAFAVGMVVDNSIVVLENIYRHHQMGKSRAKAAYDGATEVWGAVLASTLTTVAVFLPVIYVQEEVGQLFRDIAIAVSAAVLLSLAISVTLIPSLSARIIQTAGQRSEGSQSGPRSLYGIVNIASRATEGIAELIYWITGSWSRRIAVVLCFTFFSIGVSWLIMPETEYLPQGNQNLIIGLVLPPPGYNLDEVVAIGQGIEAELAPLWESKAGSDEAKKQPGGGIGNFFYVGSGGMMFMGAVAREPNRVRELISVIQTSLSSIPGAIPVVLQTSLFDQELGGGRVIDLEIKGAELERLIAVGQEIFGQIYEVLPGSQARPIPSLDLGNPEIQVKMDRFRAALVGLSNRELGYTVRALVDGAYASDYLHEGDEIDLTLKGMNLYGDGTDTLETLPINTPDGSIVTLGSIAAIERTNGPTQINRIERQRSITIQITPPEKLALERVMNIIDTGILAPLRSSGDLAGLQVDMAGAADDLTRTRRALQWNFVLALVISYLLMAALFESFLSPFVILFSVPLATLGGFLGLGAVNAVLVHQPLDVLTMLGFVILIGIVVNNAILLVHQTLNHVREGMRSREAIRESVRNRIRPITMSATTSVFGMMPLVLFPGAGSELYRGLGSVVVGGLALSTVFTLFLVPSLLSLALEVREKASEAFARFRGAREEPTPAAEPTAAVGDDEVEWRGSLSG